MNHYTDAMILTRSALSDTEFDEVARKLRDIDGVGQFTRSQYVSRAIWITYEAGKIRAQSILSQITRLGVNASLVGM